MYRCENEQKLDENSKFVPKSPYAVGKVFAYEITKTYRESYNLFAVNGILFNHESPHRGETFVTRKISRAAGRIHHQLQSKLTLEILMLQETGFCWRLCKGDVFNDAT